MKKTDKYSKFEEIERLHFDTHAKTYDKNYSYYSDFTKYKIRKKVIEFIKAVKSQTKDKNIRILEVGCGTGEYTRLIAKMLPNSSITALDISPRIIGVAKEKCKGINNIKFSVRSAYDTGYKAGTFDAICGFYVLHHLEVNKLRKESLRLLRKGGSLYFYEPNILNPMVYIIKSNKWVKQRVGDSPNEWAINPLTIKNKLQGFKVVDISTSEYIWPLSFLPTNLLITLDRVINIFSWLPLIRHLGGSVKILARKT